MVVPFSVIFTFALGFQSSFEDDVMVAPSIVKAGRKASTIIVSFEVGTVNGDPMGTI